MSTALPAPGFLVGTFVDPTAAHIDEELLSEHYFPTGYVVVAPKDGHMFLRPEAVERIVA